MKHLAAIAGYLLLLISLPLCAQQVIFTPYTMQDGLVANPVRRIFQDSKGFIWIATWGGLSKYDGHKFTNFTSTNGLSHPLVNDIYEEDDKLYVALNNGTIDVIEHDVITRKLNLTLGVNRFFANDNKILVLTDTMGVYEFKKGNLTKPGQSLSSRSSAQIVEFHDSLLLSISELDAVILNKDYQLRAKQRLPEKQLAAGDAFRCAYTDSKKRTWVGTVFGLKLLSDFTTDPQAFVFADLPKEFSIPLLKTGAILSILESSRGDYWIGASQGLIRIKPDGSSDIFTKQDGLPSEFITSILEDKEKNIWAGTTLGMAKVTTANNIEIHSMKTGMLTYNVADIGFSKTGRFLICTPAGIQEYDPLHRHFNTLPFARDTTSDFFIKKDIIFSLNPGNLVGEYDSDNRQIIIRKIPDFPYDIINDSTGALFLATVSGMSVYFKNAPSLVLSAKRTHALVLIRQGCLLYGTWDGGLHQVDYQINNNKFSYKVKDITHLINATQIRTLFKDSKGNIWIGTRYDGAFRLAKKEDTTYNVIHIGQKEGLISDWVKCFAEDKKGNIWVGTLLGLDKLIIENNKYRVFNFSRINNFFGQVVRIVPSINNTIWLIADDKLAQITDEQLETKKPLPVYITSVTLGTANQKSSQLQPDTTVSLKHFQNQLQFEFSAPGFINEKQILYSYRLTGSHETTWSTPANTHTVSYASLQPGNYNFEVRTLGWNMEWGATTHFSFTINPPFWATWWFIGICILFLGLLFYIFYRYRFNQLKKLQTVRNRIATDLHDDFGATLTTIGILSELSNKKLQEPREAKEFLTRITEEVNVLGQSLDDIIWSVNSRHDTMEETLARMRRYAAELFDNNATVCQLEFDEETAGKKLNMEQRRDVYLIYKESLNNIYKHAAAKQVWVKAGLNNHHFELLIKDDGKGFHLNQPSHRNGLKNIQARVEKWNGRINIQSEPGQGTSLQISLPIS
jgi:ligand-binding sensor domain-containing protein/two-component sensor histidine kinase